MAERVGPYRLGTTLGAGGMGRVRAATREGQAVALKWLPPDAPSEHRAAFEEEVRIMAALDHPHLLPLWDAGVVGPGQALPEGSLYLVMPRAVGSLHRPRAVEPGQVLGWVQAVLSGLAAAHAAGFLHLDVKPQNVLVGSQGEVWLADFGVADVLERRLPGLAGGTPAYMAPEQHEGDRRRQGPWTDLYAVGCTVHAWWSGRPPFGRDPVASREGHLFQAPPRLAADPGLADWVDQLLAKSPNDRFPSAAVALAALAPLAEASGPRPVAEAADLLSTTLTLPGAQPAEGRRWVRSAAIAPLPERWPEPPRNPLPFSAPSLLPLRPGRLSPGAADLLWAELQAAAAEGPRVVTVTGAEAAWSVRRFGEGVEAAIGLSLDLVTYGSFPCAGDGLAGWLARQGRSGRTLAEAGAALRGRERLSLMFLEAAEGSREALALVQHLREGEPLPVLLLVEGLPVPGCPSIVLDRPRSESEEGGFAWGSPAAAGVRIAAAVAALAPDERRAMGAAFTLGRRVDPDEWSRACAALGVPVPWARWEQWRSEGLLRTNARDPSGGWTFLGPAPAWAEALPWERAAVLAALQGGPPEAQHRAALQARVLGRRGLAARLARQAAQALLELGAVEAALAALDTWQEVAPTVGRGSLAGPLLRVEAALALREGALAAELVEAPLQRALAEGWTDLAAAALRDRARARWTLTGDPAQAVGDLVAALALEPPALLAADLHRHLGWMYLRAGDPRAELHLLQGARGTPGTAASAAWGLGEAARLRGDQAAARASLETALAGLPAHRATLLNTLGEVARAEGDLARARSLYNEALDEARVQGSPVWFYPAFNLASLDLEQRREAEAGRRLSALRKSAQRAPWAWLEGTVLLADGLLAARRAEPFAEGLLKAGLRKLDPRRGADPALSRLFTEAAGELRPELRALLQEAAAKLAVATSG